MLIRRLAPSVLLALLLASAAPARPLAADDKMPGEAAELTDEVRAKAQKLLDTLRAPKDADETAKTRRALLVLGPAIWPVVENALKLVPPDAEKPHLYCLKALLSKKVEPEFEYFRMRLRVLFLTSRPDGILGEMVTFRLGRPDPAKPSSKIPPTCKAVLAGTTSVFRSGDGSIVLAYGPDGTEKAPDALDLSISDPAAGFVAALGGKPRAAPKTSGRAGSVSANAPMGFAFAWASNGADGVRPGGMGGEGGTAEAKGGAGQHQHSGSGGNGAPDK